MASVIPGGWCNAKIPALRAEIAAGDAELRNGMRARGLVTQGKNHSGTE
jgi:hypothetical protein